MVKDAAIRQVVVRIRSIQSLERIKPGVDGKEDVVVEGSGAEKDITEYIVVQRKVVKKVEEPWMVWGTTGESKVDAILGK